MVVGRLTLAGVLLAVPSPLPACLLFLLAFAGVGEGAEASTLVKDRTRSLEAFLPQLARTGYSSARSTTIAVYALALPFHGRAAD